MELTDAIAITLKKYRKINKLSQEALALSCGLDRTYIGLLERAQRQPTLATIFKISKVLEMPPHKFVEEVEILLKN